MRNTDKTMLKNVTSLGIALQEAHGSLVTLIDAEITILEFLEVCANNHIQIKATYIGQSDEQRFS
jgi:hypothetical protein